MRRYVETNLFPLCDQITISIPLIQTKFIQLLRDFLPPVVQIINVAALLMCNSKYRPKCLTFSLPIMCIIFSYKFAITFCHCGSYTVSNSSFELTLILTTLTQDNIISTKEQRPTFSHLRLQFTECRLN